MAVLVVASLPIKAEHKDKAREICKRNIEAVHSEPGVEIFALSEGESEFVFVEQWIDAKALHIHSVGPNVATLFKEIGDYLAGPVDTKMLHPIVAGDFIKGQLYSQGASKDSNDLDHIKSVSNNERLGTSAQTSSFDELLRYDSASTAESRRVLGRAPNLDRITPYNDWSLRELVGYLSNLHRGFAASARGQAFTVTDWDSFSPSDDPIAEYTAACADAEAAFATVKDEGASFFLTNARPAPYPAAVAVGFHLLANIVHTWDIAAATGVTTEFPTDLLEAACEVARQLPSGEKRNWPGSTRPGSLFTAALEPVAGEDRLAELLRLTGREPGRQ